MVKKRNRYFLAVLIALLVGFIALAPSYGYVVRNFLSPPIAPLASSSDLLAENESLKAELAKLQIAANQTGSSTATAAAANFIRAMVYSRYPLNFKNELLVDAGAASGIVPGKAVLFRGVFVGTIYKVFADGSIVQTVFDPGFRMPVRIGGGTGAAGGIDGLLQGGTEPVVASIDKSTTVTTGDIIYSAAAGIPYALPIGTVGDVSAAVNNLFQQATVSFAYDVNGIQAVEIER